MFKITSSVVFSLSDWSLLKVFAESMTHLSITVLHTVNENPHVYLQISFRIPRIQNVPKLDSGHIVIFYLCYIHLIIKLLLILFIRDILKTSMIKTEVSYINAQMINS